MKIYSKIYLSAIAVIILLFVPLLVSATNEYDLVITERSLNVQVEDLGEIFTTQGDVKGDSYSRLAVAASGPRFRTPTEEKRIKSLQRLESYEIAAQLCSSDGLKGFVLKVEINDDSFGATIDDEYAVGKSGCSKTASGSSAIQHKSDGDLEDRYAYKNINFKEDVDKKDLFSLEDFKQGYQCDLKITNLQFPPLD
ncbi:MAG: hypothetical protein QGG82_01560 [Patescibacteria group bacterium]|nr:hypothetical protein [Patescibacteria group bacterium]